jgi:hypothetical protein
MTVNKFNVALILTLFFPQNGELVAVMGVLSPIHSIDSAMIPEGLMTIYVCCRDGVNVFPLTA